MSDQDVYANGCPYVTYDPSWDCRYKQSMNFWPFEQIESDSRCIDSNLTLSGESSYSRYNCHRSSCNSNATMVYIQLGLDSNPLNMVNCTYPGQSFAVNFSILCNSSGENC